MKRTLTSLAIVLVALATAQAPDLKVDAKFPAKAIVGDNNFELRVTNSKAEPVNDARITLSVGMTNMDMGTAHPEVTHKGDGVYTAQVNFSMGGPWRVTAKVEAPGHNPLTKSFDFNTGEPGEDSMAAMMGRLGPWSMQKEGSGTSLLPESSPMFMKMLPKAGKYDLNAMGFITFNFSDAGGKRGDDRFYSNSMLMLMARREMNGGVLGLSLMMSLDPVFNGEYGYPDLFQTGETAYGKKLTDYQHPHDLFAEIGATYSHPIGRNLNGFIYAAPVGEPALAGPVFMHRPSGVEIPEAPISHHWFDSTHIAWGVLTLGVNNEKWQVEASAFNGHEPDEDRYTPDQIRLNSASTRVTFNPTKNLSFALGYGFLHSPESTEPGVHQHRLAASAIWNQPLKNGATLATSAVFGRNIVEGEHSDAFLAETTYYQGPNSFFARWEHVSKNELVGVPDGSYMVNKFLLGGVRNFVQKDGLELGVGAYAGFYIFPRSLDPFYGKSPVTLGVFVRLRPAQMNHNMGAN